MGRRTTTVIDDDPIVAIEAMKAKPGKNIVQYGVGQLTHALLDSGQLDNGIVILSYQVR